MIHQRQNQQRRVPAKRLFNGLHGSPFAHVDKKLEAKAQLGRPPSGKALPAKERKTKSRLMKRLKPAAYAAITKLLEERYKDTPNKLTEERSKMLDKLLEHPDAGKIIAAINENPDNLGLFIPDADQGKGMLISIAGQTIDVFDYGQTTELSQSEVIDENQRDLTKKFFMTDESESKSGPGGKAPKTIRTVWNPAEKYDADNKAFIKKQKADKIKQLILTLLDSKFTPVEVVIEPAIMDDGQIIQPAKMGAAHQCVICAETVTDKWQHLEGKHNWLVRKERAKVRKHLRDIVNKSSVAVTAITPITCEPLQNPAPIISSANTSS